MAEGFPATTGDIFTAADYNGLVAFTIGAANTVDYTAVIADAYQVCELMNKATAISFNIPTNASVAFPIGTVRLLEGKVEKSTYPQMKKWMKI